MAAKSTAYVLDSFALLAYFQDEAGGRRVKAVLNQARKQRAIVWLTTATLAPGRSSAASNPRPNKTGVPITER